MRVPPSANMPEQILVGLCLALGAASTGGPLSARERALVASAARASRQDITRTRRQIREGQDPLGERFSALRPPESRRRQGAFFTPPALIQPMIEWALDHEPGRLVEPGAGSGRFVLAGLARTPDLAVVAIDVDPLATLIARANLAAVGARQALVRNADYTRTTLPAFDGRTAFVTNPPYVRHHDLDARAKAWAAQAAGRLGCPSSGLAGLHAHFFLATALRARDGDVGCFLTSAEWLDVGYGALIRALLLGRLGGRAVHVLDPDLAVFDDAMTTAAITCFEVGSSAPFMHLGRERRIEGLTRIGARGRKTARTTLTRHARWSPLLSARKRRTESVPLGALARVHRGVATGANHYFLLTAERARDLGLLAFCRPAITAAREIFAAGGILRNTPHTRLILDIPAHVDRTRPGPLAAYLDLGEHGAHGIAVADRYLPSHRTPWWRLGIAEPPPIVASYMARQPPMFAYNPDRLVPVNIAHGIYPHDTLSEDELLALVHALNHARHTFRGLGRTYQGGLEKFEPREMEALPVPDPASWPSAWPGA